ncbi:MAG: hypothetical protein HYY22_09655 [Thaumarchaeota archaeon]|nr:hypothetical protein [Nitrososphaerota archaeon]
MVKSAGKDRIEVAGLGAIAKNQLAQRGVVTFEDLARTDPFNYGLRFLGDKLEGWVNFARQVLADEVIREIHVGEPITVRCTKTYDVELTLQAVKARLGVYEYYVEVSRRVLPDLYEFTFTINQQHRQYALGSWLEYKQTARMLDEGLHKTSEKETAAPPKEIKEIPYPELLSLLAPEVLDIGDVPLIKEVLLHLLFADRLNVLVIAAPSVGAKTLLRNALERCAPALYNHYCGSRDSHVDFAEALSGIGEGVLALAGLDAMTGDEKVVLYDILSSQQVKIRPQGYVYEYEAKINIYAQANPTSSTAAGRGKHAKPTLPVDEKFLEYCHCTILSKPYSAAEFEDLTRFIPTAKKPSEENVKKLRGYLQRARSIQLIHDGPPEEVYEFLKAVYRQREKLPIPITAEMEKGIIELAKAHSRIRLSSRVNRDDFLYALRLMEACLERIGFQSGGAKK